MEKSKESNSHLPDVSLGDATARVGCFGLDWTQVTVNDLFKVFESALSYSSPRSVKLYKTKTGREKLGNSSTFRKKVEEGSIQECYVAVAEFCSVEEAMSVYKFCDESWLEGTEMVFDLRFIADSIVLENPCDEAFSSENHASRSRLHDDSEDEDMERAKELKRLFEMKEIDFDAMNRLVDMSDDEDTSKGLSATQPDAPQIPVVLEEFGSEEDLNEACKELTRRSKKKSKVAEPASVEHPKPNVVKMMSEEKVEDEYRDFVFNPKDERFQSLFEDAEFTIDPTHPEYKKKGGMKEILDEKRKRFRDSAE